MKKTLKELKEEWNDVIDEMEKRQDRGLSTEDLVKKRDKLQKQIEKKEKEGQKLVPFTVRIDPVLFKKIRKSEIAAAPLIRNCLEKVFDHRVCPICGGEIC